MYSEKFNKYLYAIYSTMQSVIQIQRIKSLELHEKLFY